MLDIEEVDCNLCGKNEAKLLFSLEDRSWTSHLTGEWNIVQCENCQLVYLNPRPIKETLKIHYEKQYMKPGMSWLSKLFESLKEIQEHLTKKIPLKENGRLLDVGCGTGRFLVRQRDRGYEVYGVDIDESACEYVNRCGLTAFCGELRDTHWPDEYFDVMTFWDCLEHDFNPLETLKITRRILKKKGILILSLQNFASLERKFFQKEWSYFSVPRHLYHFTPETISNLLFKAGFTVEKIKFSFFHPQLWTGSLLDFWEDRFPCQINLKCKLIFMLLLFPVFLPLNAICSILGQGSIMVIKARKD